MKYKKITFIYIVFIIFMTLSSCINIDNSFNDDNEIVNIVFYDGDGTILLEIYAFTDIDKIFYQGNKS